jgi:hypothetical protein
VYLYQESGFKELYGTWDYEKFEKESLPSFVEMCKKFSTETQKRIPF